MAANFKTDDWQYFLKDLVDKVDALRPDENEVEKSRANDKARGAPSFEPPTTTSRANFSSSSRKQSVEEDVETHEMCAVPSPTTKVGTGKIASKR